MTRRSRYRSKVIALCLVLSSLCAGAAPAQSVPAEYTVLRQIRWRFVLENPTRKPLAAQVLRAYAPVKQTATQWTENLAASHPYELESDPLGNQIMVFRFSELPPFATRIVSIVADLRLAPNPQPTPMADTTLAMGEERHIEANHREMVSSAREIISQVDGNVPSAIYKWVRGHMFDSGFIAEDLGALYALRNRRGDCTEYANLFVALARTLGIPARTLGGYVLAANSAPKPGEYHNWAEYYADGTWQLSDPQKGNFRRNAEQYIAMRVISARTPNSLRAAHRYLIEGEMTVRMEP